ncbi:MAG: endolytic transglycosylase MltG [Bacteroidetes bacterium]|nr:endolytic transglycosylase MltG [Bacteroidota bacterium]
MKWIVRIFIVALLLAGAGVAYFAMNYVYNKNTGFSEAQKMLYIKTGSSFEDVVRAASEQNIIKDLDAFKWLANKKKYIGKVRPGCYKIKKDMTNEQIVNLLRAGVQEPLKVTFNNIRTVELLAGRIAAQLEADSTSLFSYLADSATASQYGFNSQNFISMFIPNTYEMYWNTTTEGFVKRMAREYKSFWNDKRKARPKN